MKKKNIFKRIFGLALLIPFSVVCVYLSFLSSHRSRIQEKQYTESVIDFYVSSVDNVVANVNRRLAMLLLEGSSMDTGIPAYVDVIQSTENEAYKNYYITKLQETFQFYSDEYGGEYNFFAFFPFSELYIGVNKSGLSQVEWSSYCKDLKDKLVSGELEVSGRQQWQTAEMSGKKYIMKSYKMHDIYIGCWIKAEQLIGSMKDLTRDHKSSIILYDRPDHYLAVVGDNRTTQRGTGWQDRVSHSLFSDFYVLDREFENLPFRLRFVVYDNNIFTATSAVLAVLVAVTSILLLLLIASMLYLYHYVLVPIRKFSDNIDRMRSGKDDFNVMTKSEIYELEQASQEFRAMLKKINLLEAEVYKAEIEKQYIYMDYLKLQIKPHFYINCLNFIYNMIDLGKGATAMEMSKATAEFFRYLLQENKSLVCLKDEIKHVTDYLRIQKLRFEEKVEYCVEVEDEIEDVCIPPLIIETFVENCIKYAIGSVTVCRINVTVFSETINDRQYVNICITDNGPGFAPEILTVLNRSHSYNERVGIGTYSTIKRLKYLYQGQAEIKFYNCSPNNGAIVDIHVPYVWKCEEVL